MADRNIIRIYYKNEDGSIVQRAQHIVDVQYKIAQYLGQMEWYLPDKKVVDFDNIDLVRNALLKRIKKLIIRYSDLKDIDDEFIDTGLTVNGFYSSKGFDEESYLNYWIGGESNSLLISNYDSLQTLSSFVGLKHFVLKLIEMLNPISIEVSNYEFYRRIMDLDGDEYWPGDLTYFSSEIRLPILLKEVGSQHLENGGILISISADFFDPTDSGQLSVAKDLVATFKKYGIAP